MCTRFSLGTDPSSLAKHFNIKQLPPFEPNYNIASKEEVATIRAGIDATAREVKWLDWGLLFQSDNDSGAAKRPLCVQRDQLENSQTYRNLLRNKRCLILADGFYLWPRGEDQARPTYFTLLDDQPFAIAGIWDLWRPQEDAISTCAIITVPANEIVQPLADWMPAILPPEEYDRWLDPRNTGIMQLSLLLNPFPATEMDQLQVGNYVNDPANKGSKCTDPGPTPDA